MTRLIVLTVLCFFQSQLWGQIDADSVWYSYYGGANEETLNDVCVDKEGNIIAVGYTMSMESIAMTTCIGSSGFDSPGKNGFVTKFSKNGERLWGIYLGGTNTEGISITTDKDNNIIIGGYTDVDTPSDTLFKSPIQSTAGGGKDGFIAKLDPFGCLFWATYFGSNGNEEIRGIDTDSLGNIYVTGQTKSDSLPKSGNSGLKGFENAFIAKIQSEPLDVLWTKYYGNKNTYANSIDVNSAGDIIITGYTDSDTDIAKGTVYKDTLSGNNDSFVASFFNDGTWNWGTYLGGNSFDEGNDICWDNDSNILVIGETNSASLFSSGIAKPFPTISNNLPNAFVVKLNKTGEEQLWGTYYGDESIGLGIAVDPFDNIYITGETGTSNRIDIDSRVVYQSSFKGPNISGGKDGFFWKI